MKRLHTGLWAFTLFSWISFAPAVMAQTSIGTGTAGSFSYDVSREVAITATVSSVLAKPSPGMIMGSHLLLNTTTGPVDVSLGRFALRGKGALSVGAGRQVEVIGVMKTLNGRQVFLARIVKVGGENYTIRNQRGLVVSPQARERAGLKAAGEGL
jgi:hypothetical protein